MWRANQAACGDKRKSSSGYLAVCPTHKATGSASRLVHREQENTADTHVHAHFTRQPRLARLALHTEQHMVMTQAWPRRAVRSLGHPLPGLRRHPHAVEPEARGPPLQPLSIAERLTMVGGAISPTGSRGGGHSSKWAQNSGQPSHRVAGEAFLME